MPTRVYVEASGRRILPFDDPVVDTPIQSRPLSEWQAQAIAEAGLERVQEPISPCLIIPDTLFCSGDALRQFVEGAAGRNAVLVLKQSRFGEATTPVQPHVVKCEAGWRFEKIRYLGTGEVVDVVVDPNEEEMEFPAPTYFQEGGTIKMGMPRDPVMTLHHWVHILWVNQLPGGMELLRGS